MTILGICVLLACVPAWPGDPVILENAQVRLELEPDSFDVRFLGAPGGKSFVEPVHLASSTREGAGGAVPGGITTNVIPTAGEALLFHDGPSTIVEHRSDYALFLGPRHESGWQLKKEYRLAPDAAAITCTTSVLSSRKREQRVCVRIAAQLPWAGILAVPKAYGQLGLLRGTYDLFPTLMAEEGETYGIPVATFADRKRAMMTAPAHEVTYTTKFGRWERRIAIQGVEDEMAPGAAIRLLVLADDPSHTYRVAFEVSQAGVNVGVPLVVVEHWRLRWANESAQD